MLKKSAISLALVSAFLLTPPTRAQSPDLETPASIQKLVDDGNFRPALLDTSRILALKGPAAAAYDRYDMLMLRAECQLQLHDQPAALASLELARKEAFLQQNPTRAAQPVAFSHLIRQSKALMYEPKVAGHLPAIALLDRTKRKDAYTALLTDELPQTIQKLKLLPDVKNLPALIDLAKTAGTTRAIELIATQDSYQTAPLTHEVADQAEQLVDLQIDQISTRVSAISDHANQLISEPYSVVDPASKHSTIFTRTRRRGPDATETQYLQNIQSTSEKISASVVELAQALIFETDTMKAIVAKADTLTLQAKNLLHDNYYSIPNP